jgi:hypothetical protein
MYNIKYIFPQVMAILPWQRFQTCVDRYHGDYKVISLTTQEFFKVMAFAQITGLDSLSSTALCLNALSSQCYHFGIRSEITKSNLAHANNQRNWKIFFDFAQILIKEATKLYRNDPIKLDINDGVYALDSTTIDLCLSLFPWAHFRKTKSAIKMHTMINLKGKIPDFILISTGKMHDVNAMDAIDWEAGCWYVMDRGYLDFERLYHIHECRAWFVTRSKKNTQYKRVYSKKVDKSKGILCDQKVRLTGTNATKDYPELIRRIKFIDGATGKRLVFLTNNMIVSAETITQVYKNRWHVELFFKWIKQHLCVKRFFGHSDNAVRSQIWIAMCVYLLILILKKNLGLDYSAYQILQILKVSTFNNRSLSSMFLNENTLLGNYCNPNQRLLFKL